MALRGPKHPNWDPNWKAPKLRRGGRKYVTGDRYILPSGQCLEYRGKYHSRYMGDPGNWVDLLTRRGVMLDELPEGSRRYR